jgi:NAD(P)-dependent dehydrogenase (short-subunit alcohol dehydrogenase family)
MDLELGGSVIMVTGGSDGLGRALCLGLAREGARVAFCGRNEQRLAEVAHEVEELGSEALGYVCDVRDPQQLAGFVEATRQRFGRIDGLVNNAGARLAKSLRATTDEEWHDDLELKVMAAVRLSRLVLDDLAASSHGSIVNVLATAGKAPEANSFPTSVARSAGLAFTKALSKELGPQQIRVNAVVVGIVASGQWRRAADAAGVDEAEIHEGLVALLAVPMGRIGRPEEFSDLVTFLLSPRASYISGAAINLDGGASPVS